MRVFLLIATFCYSASIFSQDELHSAASRLKGLDSVLGVVLKDQLAAGFAVAVVEKGEIIYTNGFGFRDYENKKSMTPNTLFAIGSCTKAFTASLVGMLQQEKKLNIDEPVVKYLSDLKFYQEGLTRQVTIRDMMSHRTGLPRHDFSWYLFKASSRDSLMHRTQYLQPSVGIREKWQYNNFMYVAQGVIVERLTGKSWEDNIQTQIFQPLGMTRSNTSIDALTRDTNIAIGYQLKNGSVIEKMDYYRNEAVGPAGNINSSVTEMAKWVSLWINGGKFQGKQIIPAAYIRDAISSQMIIAAGLPTKEQPDTHFSNYGLGWFLNSYKGHYRVEHGGNIDGFTASTCFFPSDSIGIVVLSNQNGSAIPQIVRNIIADRMLNLPYYDWNKSFLESRRKAAEMAKSLIKPNNTTQENNVPTDQPIKAYAGTYFHPGYGRIVIEHRNDSLFSYAGKYITYLKHLKSNVFMPFQVDQYGQIDMITQSPLRFQFSLNEDGAVLSFSVKFEPAIEPLRFEKVDSQ